MTPYFEHAGIAIYHGDARELLSELGGGVDLFVADPPYGETALAWDVPVDGWLAHARRMLLPSGCVWCFGSMRMFLSRARDFDGWALAQDVVWEKHNGSSFHADRFKRVHELALQFYRGPWDGIYKRPVTTLDATARAVRRKQRPPHMGAIAEGSYVSEDGGPRLMRSVIAVRSCHGHAVHPTQKPVGIVAPLVEYSCPPGGLIVVDPMMGSGTTLVVARQTGRRAIGIDVDEQWREVAARRLVQEMPLLGGAA